MTARRITQQQEASPDLDEVCTRITPVAHVGITPRALVNHGEKPLQFYTLTQYGSKIRQVLQMLKCRWMLSLLCAAVPSYAATYNINANSTVDIPLAQQGLTAIQNAFSFGEPVSSSRICIRVEGYNPSTTAPGAVFSNSTGLTYRFKASSGSVAPTQGLLRSSNIYEFHYTDWGQNIHEVKGSLYSALISIVGMLSGVQGASFTENNYVADYWAGTLSTSSTSNNTAIVDSSCVEFTSFLNAQKPMYCNSCANKDVPAVWWLNGILAPYNSRGLLNQQAQPQSWLSLSAPRNVTAGTSQMLVKYEHNGAVVYQESHTIVVTNPCSVSVPSSTYTIAPGGRASIIVNTNQCAPMTYSILPSGGTVQDATGLVMTSSGGKGRLTSLACTNGGGGVYAAGASSSSQTTSTITIPTNACYDASVLPGVYKSQFVVRVNPR